MVTSTGMSRSYLARQSRSTPSQHHSGDDIHGRRGQRERGTGRHVAPIQHVETDNRSYSTDTNTDGKSNGRAGGKQ